MAPVSPSKTLPAAMESAGSPSSSTIVPTPARIRRVARLGERRVTSTVSFPSSLVSPDTDTVIVFSVSPGAKVSVPGARAV